jgi:hypothetical protein
MPRIAGLLAFRDDLVREFETGRSGPESVC